MPERVVLRVDNPSIPSPDQVQNRQGGWCARHGPASAALYSAKTSAAMAHDRHHRDAGHRRLRPDETCTQTDAVRVLNWVEQKHIATLSFWALQRDNGGCPGTKGAGTCSRIKQPTWWFSHTFEPFTR